MDAMAATSSRVAGRISVVMPVSTVSSLARLHTAHTVSYETGETGSMVAIVLALASAVSFGGSDYTAGLATRVTSVISAVGSAGLSVGAGLLFGERPGGLAVAGAASGGG